MLISPFKNKGQNKQVINLPSYSVLLPERFFLENQEILLKASVR
jgi:hypothetical protein